MDRHSVSGLLVCLVVISIAFPTTTANDSCAAAIHDCFKKNKNADTQCTLFEAAHACVHNLTVCETGDYPELEMVSALSYTWAQEGYCHNNLPVGECFTYRFGQCVQDADIVAIMNRKTVENCDKITTNQTVMVQCLNTLAGLCPKEELRALNGAVHVNKAAKACREQATD